MVNPGSRGWMVIPLALPHLLAVDSSFCAVYFKFKSSETLLYNVHNNNSFFRNRFVIRIGCLLSCWDIRYFMDVPTVTLDLCWRADDAVSKASGHYFTL